jgi:hypothetical protein
MIGQRIEARPLFPRTSFIMLLAALALCGTAIYQTQRNWAVASVVFFFLAIAAWLRRQRAFALVLSDHGLQVQGRSEPIPYTSIQSIRAPGRPADLKRQGPAHYPLDIIHAGGVLQIPARLSCPSDQLYFFLIGQLTPSGSDRVAPVLKNFLGREALHHGDENVFTFCAREYLGGNFSYRRTAAYCAAIALASGVWLILGIGHVAAPAWTILGSLLGLLSLFSAFLFAFQGRTCRMPGKWRHASIVISPTGLAMVQGELQGEMSWSELRAAEASWKHSIGGYRSEGLPGGIQLRFEGASVVIGDLYDRPIPMIYETITSLWQSGFRRPSVPRADIP